MTNIFEKPNSDIYPPRVIKDVCARLIAHGVLTAGFGRHRGKPRLPAISAVTRGLGPMLITDHQHQTKVNASDAL